MKKTLLFAGLVIAAAAALFVVLGAADKNAFPKSAVKTYSNQEYGISFEYPEGYVLTEGEKGDAHRGHYAVVLVKSEDTAPRENGEGPTAITVDMYQNSIDKMTVSDWVLNTNVANFKLSDGTYAVTSVGGVPALSNKWSGLYEGMTTTFLHKENAITVSATYLAKDDANLAAYETVLASFKLTGGSVGVQSTPVRATLSGTFVCLGYKDAGPHNQNCVPGIKTDAGAVYELDTMLMSAEAPMIRTGDAISASGVLVPAKDLGIEWGMRNYAAAGRFSVTDSLFVR